MDGAALDAARTSYKREPTLGDVFLWRRRRSSVHSPGPRPPSLNLEEPERVWMHRWGFSLGLRSPGLRFLFVGASWAARSDGEAPPTADVQGDFTKAQGASPWSDALHVGSAGRGPATLLSGPTFFWVCCCLRSCCFFFCFCCCFSDRQPPTFAVCDFQNCQEQFDN